MTALDYIVLIGYFVVMAGIGIWTMRRIKAQEDYFLGGRKFGKMLQAFAAFGAGTGSSDPINTARTSFTSGLSGMWSIMSWLFVTPFYWIAGVWYRRMRHLTLGDWFVERYDSKALGAAYTVFGLLFYMVYTAMAFTAIGKAAAPLMGNTINLMGNTVGIEYVLVPAIAVIVMIYGVLGGLTAAYWTDLIQGICIILLSVLLIPFGLNALVEKFGDPSTQGVMHGFTIMHEQIPGDFFTIFGSTNASEFPLSRIMAIFIISLVGVVVMPHFIATGGGSAKTEFNARVGLVAGNFAKRFCTIGWAFTALIVLALMSDSPELATDPDKTWGIASRELLGPGLLGLMMACLLAALMSSADCYMIVCSGLIARNIYAAYINPDASEKQYILIARFTGVLVIAGAVLVSWLLMDVFKQLQLTWIVPLLFAAPFWIGMYWRRATTKAAWGTIIYVALIFFVIPWLAPVFMPGLRTSEKFTQTNQIITTTVTRSAAPSDVAHRKALISIWEDKRDAIHEMEDIGNQEIELADLGESPQPLILGDAFTKTSSTGGKAIYWSAGVTPVGAAAFEIVRVVTNGAAVVETKRYTGEMKAAGNFNLELMLYDLLGMDLTKQSNAMLATFTMPPKIIMPFLVMILLSFLTHPNRSEVLDRYYAKMRTPVDPDPETDRKKLEQAYQNPGQTERKKLFPNSTLEFQKPTTEDVVGFLISFAICFFIIFLAMAVARIGA